MKISKICASVIAGIMVCLPVAALAQSYYYDYSDYYEYGYSYDTSYGNSYAYYPTYTYGSYTPTYYAPQYYQPVSYYNYPSYPSSGYGTTNYGYGSTPSPYNASYATGDTDTFGYALCNWEGYYGRARCDSNPRQPVYDHWTGTWY